MIKVKKRSTEKACAYYYISHQNDTRFLSPLSLTGNSKNTKTATAAASNKKRKKDKTTAAAAASTKQQHTTTTSRISYFTYLRSA